MFLFQLTPHTNPDVLLDRSAKSEGDSNRC